MRSNKIKALMLAITAIMVQSTCAYAASSSETGYTKEELNNLKPGYESKDQDKSNYNVNSYTNNFINPTATNESDNSDTKTEDSSTNWVDSIPGKSTDDKSSGSIVSTQISTGNEGDFWAKTSDGKWMLIEQGVPAWGWKMVNGNWYYMDQSGIMQTGWLNYNSKWYYLKENGAMEYDTVVDGYYLDSDGAAVI